MAENWHEILEWGEEQVTDLRLAGFGFLKQGQYPRAQAYFEALVALHPESLYDLYTLGGLYLQVKDPERALRTLDQALALEPTCVPALINKTKAYFELGQTDDGLHMARQLARLDHKEARQLGEAFVLAYS